MKNIYLLGAAGSIGLQTLDVIEQDPHQFQLIGLSLGSNDDLNHQILHRFDVEMVCLRHEKQLDYYQNQYPHIHFVFGDKGLIELAKYPKNGLFVNALSGSSGLYPTVMAIKHKKDIALANKETLVMAGDLINQLIQEYNVSLYPIDSEHSSLWQALRGEKMDDVSKLVITASGGSFRHLTRDELVHVTVDEALKHPNWSMGAKITIDSATMMNKGLEVIEAHHLFHLPYHQIETVLHKESLVHGLIYFKDGTIKASLSHSDMRIPIAYALYYPDRRTYDSTLELTELHFSKMDFDRYPLLKLAFEVGTMGGIMPTVMNAANEAAVKLFLDKKISFLDIEEIIIQHVKQAKQISNPTLENILQVNEEIQHHILRQYEKR
jgi:1-deoxy-D-xylulose-5-phosphate reductoisomerase